uniref:5'-AMP-activated protein kinase catalytic subunit alpha-1-like n=1 Tax=Myxine glutinosa TaxID=7769 RepID=UPI00358ED1A2
MMRRLHHPHIVKLIGVHQDQILKEVVIAMEYVPAGSLDQHFVRQKQFSSPKAWWVMKQMASAFTYMHKKNIVHRDIKLDNVVCNDRWFVKVIDFGFARICKPYEKLNTYCGTPAYMAPEIFNRVKYEGPPADVWALGILSTKLFVGCKVDVRRLFQLDYNYSWVFKLQQCPDKLLTSLLTGMLWVNPQKRLTMNNISKHEWFKQKIHLYKFVR